MDQGPTDSDAMKMLYTEMYKYNGFKNTLRDSVRSFFVHIKVSLN